jgi:hypothetical protein
VFTQVKVKYTAEIVAHNFSKYEDKYPTTQPVNIPPIQHRNMQKHAEFIVRKIAQ